eukprot:519455-Hanusia_phi.AAC.1
MTKKQHDAWRAYSILARAPLSCPTRMLKGFPGFSNPLPCQPLPGKVKREDGAGHGSEDNVIRM